MKVLIYAPAFLPHLGGLEVQTSMLADGLVDLGDEVAVLTRTPGDLTSGSFAVVREPSRRDFLRWVKWSDAVLHQNLSLRGLWPLGVIQRPLVVAHHGWYRRPGGRIGVRDRIKRAIIARAKGSISVSRAVAEDLGSSSVVVPNAYRVELFRDSGGKGRTRTLLFVGRLVSQKGVDLLLKALELLGREGARPDLTIVGEGPERAMLERLRMELGLEHQVEFVGELEATTLAEVYREHRIVVVPSRKEPFGMVALEAIASGCAVVAANDGGLPEAVGPCGVLFQRGDVAELVSALSRLTGPTSDLTHLSAMAPEHLARHHPRAMAEGYRTVLLQAVAGARG